MSTRRLILLALLMLGVSLFTGGDASACHRRGCYTPCYCYCPCPPSCHPCYCLAYRDPYRRTGAMLVWCNSCPSHLPGWNYCYVFITGTHEWVKVYRCFHSVQDFDDDARKAEGFEKVSMSLSQPASVVVSLPDDAILTIDGHSTAHTSEVRRFVSPALPFGKEYQYTFKAEVKHGGETLTATQTVVVRAGEESRLTLIPKITTRTETEKQVAVK